MNHKKQKEKLIMITKWNAILTGMCLWLMFMLPWFATKMFFLCSVIYMVTLELACLTTLWTLRIFGDATDTVYQCYTEYEEEIVKFAEEVYSGD